MKSCMLLLTALLLSVSTVAKDRYHLIIGGEFLGGQSVKYEVYKVTGTSSEKYFVGKNRHGFNLQVNVGENYLIKFKSNTGIEKDMYISVTKAGTFVVDVDFSKNQSAKISYDHHKHTYIVEPVSTEGLLSLADK